MSTVAHNFIDLNGLKYYHNQLKTNFLKDYKGATASADGEAGFVPPALAADRDKFLKGDGTWGEVQTDSSAISSLETDIRCEDEQIPYFATSFTLQIQSQTNETIDYTSNVVSYEYDETDPILSGNISNGIFTAIGIVKVKALAGSLVITYTENEVSTVYVLEINLSDGLRTFDRYSKDSFKLPNGCILNIYVSTASRFYQGSYTDATIRFEVYHPQASVERVIRVDGYNWIHSSLAAGESAVLDFDDDSFIEQATVYFYPTNLTINGNESPVISSPPYVAMMATLDNVDGQWIMSVPPVDKSNWPTRSGGMVLAADLVATDIDSNETRVDLKPLLNYIGGRIEEVPSGDLEMLPLVDTENPGVEPPFYFCRGLNFINSGDSIYPDADVFSDGALTVSFSASSPVPESFTPIFYYGSPSGGTGLGYAKLDSSTGVPAEFTLETALAGPLVLDEFDFSSTSNTPVPTGNTVSLVTEQVEGDSPTYRFTLYSSSGEMKKVLRLYPSCDNNIDLSPLVDELVSNSNSNISFQYIPFSTGASSAYTASAVEYDGTLRFGAKIAIDGTYVVGGEHLTEARQTNVSEIQSFQVTISSGSIYHPNSIIALEFHISQGSDDFWVAYTLKASFRDLLAAGATGLPMTEDSSKAYEGSYLLEEHSKALYVSCTNNNDGTYAFYPFIVDVILENAPLTLQNPSGTTSTANLLPLRSGLVTDVDAQFRINEYTPISISRTFNVSRCTFTNATMYSDNEIRVSRNLQNVDNVTVTLDNFSGNDDFTRFTFTIPYAQLNENPVIETVFLGQKTVSLMDTTFLDKLYLQIESVADDNVLLRVVTNVSNAEIQLTKEYASREPETVSIDIPIFGREYSYPNITEGLVPRADYDNDASKFLRGDGTWAEIVIPSAVTSAELSTGTDTSTKTVTAQVIHDYVAGEVASGVAGLVNSAPATLDTLNELATALGNDPNFATTISGQIGGKLDASSANYVKSLSISGQTITVTKGDNTTGTLTTQDTTYSAGTGLSLSGTTFSVASTAGTSTLAWNSEVTLGTVGGLAIKAKLPVNPDTHKTTHLYVGSSGATANAATTTNTTTFLSVVDDTTASDSIQITGSGGASVTAAAGVITIDVPEVSSITNAQIDAMFA